MSDAKVETGAREIIADFIQEVKFPVRVYIPDGVEYRREVYGHLVRSTVEPNTWLTLSVAAAEGLVRVEPLVAEITFKFERK